MTLVLIVFWAATTTTIFEIASDRIQFQFLDQMGISGLGDSNLAAWLQPRPIAMLLLPWPPLHQRTPVLLLLLLLLPIAADVAAVAVAVAAVAVAVAVAGCAAAVAGGSNCY